MTVKNLQPVHERTPIETEVLPQAPTTAPEADSFSPVPVPGLLDVQVHRMHDSASAGRPYPRKPDRS